MSNIVCVPLFREIQNRMLTLSPLALMSSHAVAHQEPSMLTSASSLLEVEACKIWTIHHLQNQKCLLVWIQWIANILRKAQQAQKFRENAAQQLSMNPPVWQWQHRKFTDGCCEFAKQCCSRRCEPFQCAPRAWQDHNKQEPGNLLWNPLWILPAS